MKGLYIVVDGQILKEEFKKANRDYYSLEACEKIVLEEEQFDVFNDGMELDIIELCGRYSEYESVESVKNDYDDLDIENMKDMQKYFILSNKHVLINVEF